MKTVLFCGGLGTRIRDFSENIPKPMIPIGGKPILWHLMSYYSQYGHKDFILCLGYKANVIKEFFLNYRPHIYADCVVSGFGSNVETLGDPQQDWRVTMIDTGVWRNIGERLFAVQAHLEGEEMFLANYSDGLSDVDLPAMIETFKQSGKVACFLACRPSFSLHLIEMDASGRVNGIRATQDANLWINGGFFIFRSQIFDYMREGEELVEEALPAADRCRTAPCLQARGLLAPDGHIEGQRGAGRHGRAGPHALAALRDGSSRFG